MEGFLVCMKFLNDSQTYHSEDKNYMYLLILPMFCLHDIQDVDICVVSTITASP